MVTEMAYTVPQFNILVDVWDAGHVPDDDAPDFENVTGQLYVYSRVSFDVQPCDLELYQPALQLRLPLDVLAIWVSSQVYEIPAESGRYYRARFKERVHIGFPNEYLVAYVVQCNGAGVAIARDIEFAVECPEGGGGTGEGEMAFACAIECEAEGTVGSTPPEIQGDGVMTFDVQMLADGEGTVS